HDVKCLFAWPDPSLVFEPALPFVISARSPYCWSFGARYGFRVCPPLVLFSGADGVCGFMMDLPAVGVCALLQPVVQAERPQRGAQLQFAFRRRWNSSRDHVPAQFRRGHEPRESTPASSSEVGAHADVRFLSTDDSGG